MKGHVGQQGASGVVIWDGKTLFENAALGARLSEGEVKKQDVGEACRLGYRLFLVAVQV